MNSSVTHPSSQALKVCSKCIFRKRQLREESLDQSKPLVSAADHPWGSGKSLHPCRSLFPHPQKKGAGSPQIENMVSVFTQMRNVPSCLLQIYSPREKARKVAKRQFFLLILTHPLEDTNSSLPACLPSTPLPSQKLGRTQLYRPPEPLKLYSVPACHHGSCDPCCSDNLIF